MRKLLLSLITAALLLAGGNFSLAQNTTGLVVSSCGTVTSAFVAGRPGPFTVDPNGLTCFNGSVTITFPAIGAAVPATGIYNGINVAGTLRGWSGLSTGSIFPGAVAIVDASGTQITSFGGAITSWAGGTLGAMANYGTSPGAVLVPGVNAFVTNLPVAQGSTTAGQQGPLVQCAVTTSSPSYTTAQTDPLSCDPSGLLRVNVISATGLAAGSTTAGQTGSLIMGAVTTNAPSYTTGQTNYISFTTAGGVRVDLKDSAANTNPFVFTGSGAAGSAAAGVVTVQGIASMTPFLTNPGTPANWGIAATGATAPVNALLHGGTAQNAEATAVTNGQLKALVTDLVGKLITLPYANPENFLTPAPTAAITDTTSTSIMASAGGSLRNYVTSCMVTNSHATVGTFVKILDGASIIDEGYAAAAGGGFVRQYPVPLRGTAATAVNCQAVTTGANFICSCQGYKGI